MKKGKRFFAFAVALFFVLTTVWGPEAGEALAAEETDPYDYVWEGEMKDICFQASPHYFSYGVNGNTSGWLGWAEIYRLVDGDGAEHQAYCIDMDTGTKKSFRYRRMTLEEAAHPLLTEPYFSEEEAAILRTIVKNGYWAAATDPTDPDANAELKRLRQAIGIADLTSGEALLGTQLAIWTYGERGSKFKTDDLYRGTDLEDPENTGSALYYSKWPVAIEREKVNTEDGRTGTVIEEHIEAVYNYLIDLGRTKPEAASPGNIVFSDKYFVEISEISTGGMEAQYVITLQFSLKSTVTEKDDLTLTAVQGEKALYSGKLGKAFDAESPQLTYDGAVYTLKVSSSDLTTPIDLKLEGEQYLERDVYLYVSEAKEAEGENGETVMKASQNLVGIGEGSTLVKAAAQIELPKQTEKPPAAAVLEAWKTMDGKAPADGVFSFVLQDELGNRLQTVSNTGSAVQFQELTFTGPGTYRYTIFEATGQDLSVDYDETVYTAVVTVERNDGDGSLRAEVCYEKNGAVYEGIPSFANCTSDQTVDGDVPTGDPGSLWLWPVLTVLSGAVLAALFWTGNKLYLKN